VVGRRRAVLPVRRRRRDTRGASAVEFALVVPLLCALLFGSITAGFLFFNYISVNDSVRAGARFGATAVGTPSLPVNWPAAAVRQRTVDYSANTLALSQVCVALMRGGATLAAEPTTCPVAIGPAPADPSGLAATDCVVKVWAARPQTLSAPPLYTTELTLRRGSVSRYERPCL